MPARRRAALLLLLVVAVLAAGCGKSNEDQIRENAGAIAAAIQKSDFSGACAYAAPQLLSSYGGPAGCAAALGSAVQRTGFDAAALRIDSVSVLGATAAVTVSSPIAFQVEVQKVNGKWLVAGL